MSMDTLSLSILLSVLSDADRALAERDFLLLGEIFVNAIRDERGLTRYVRLDPANVTIRITTDTGQP